MTKEVIFEVTAWETTQIHMIAKRAVEMARADGIKAGTLLDLSMDITACHANGNPLRLDDLLKADKGNFGHDVFGIQRFIDRETGKLQNHFRPRYSRKS